MVGRVLFNHPFILGSIMVQPQFSPTAQSSDSSFIDSSYSSGSSVSSAQSSGSTSHLRLVDPLVHVPLALIDGSEFKTMKESPIQQRLRFYEPANFKSLVADHLRSDQPLESFSPQRLRSALQKAQRNEHHRIAIQTALFEILFDVQQKGIDLSLIHI